MIYNFFLFCNLNGAETNCRTAHCHVFGILLMSSYWFAFYFSDIIVVYSFNFNLTKMLLIYLQNQQKRFYS